MAFLYPFFNFMQPGILWPWLATFKPMLMLSILAVVTSLARRDGSTEQQLNYLRHTTFISLLIYVALQVVSVYRSGMASMVEEFGLWYVFVLQVAISLLLLRNVSTLRMYVWGFILGGSVVIGYGLWTYLTRSPSLAGRPVGAYGMYENHNDYTFMAISLLPYSWMLLRSQTRFIAKAALVTVTLGCMIGVVLSLSRGGILVLALEVGWLIFVTTRGTRRVAILSFLLLCAPIVIVHQFVARDAGRTNDYTIETAKSSRFELWSAAGNMILKHPLLGIGSHRFHEYSSDYGEISHDNKGKVTHNTYLEVATGSGLLGFSSFVLMMWAALSPLFRDRSRKSGASDALVDIRTASMIAISCFLMRAMLDEKIFDPAIYTLLSLAIASVRISAPQTDTDSNTHAAPETPGLRAASRIYPSYPRNQNS